jgi:glycerophosphoryl diester phosphodiesterase
MVVIRVGDWTVLYPYDSMPAFQRAYEDTCDAVKGDFRVSSDNIGVVMHSSPIQFYESIDCWGYYVEKMTAAGIVLVVVLY